MRLSTAVLTLLSATAAVARGSFLADDFGTDGFASNALAKFGNGTISTTGHSTASLSDGSIVITGTIKANGGVFHPNVSDETDIVIPRTGSLIAALVMVINSDGGIAWAKRTVSTQKNVEFVTAVDSKDNIYVVGSSAGISRDGTIESPGMIFLKYSSSGERKYIVSHGGTSGAKHVGLLIDPKAEGSILLASWLPVTTGSKVAELSDPPTKGALAVAKVSAGTGDLISSRIITIGMNNTVLDEVYHDIALSSNGDVLFLVCKRTTKVLMLYTISAVVYSISTSTLQDNAPPRQLRYMLQNKMRLATVPHSDDAHSDNGMYLGYVSRLENEECIRVQRFTSSITEQPWRHSKHSEFQHKLTVGNFTRLARADVQDITVDTSGNVRLLMYSSEILNRTKEITSGPDDKLSNGRPSVVVISSSGELSSITQSNETENWIPNAIIAGQQEYIVVGSDKGNRNSLLSANPRVLLTGIKAPYIAPNPSPTSSSEPVSTVLERSDSSKTCIGASSIVGGTLMKEIISRDNRLRLQKHPLRNLAISLRRDVLKPVRMLCHTWSNRTSNRPTGNQDVLCATSHHIIIWHGRHLYMHELCDSVETPCTIRYDEPINFKGPCGAHIYLHGHLQATMHATTSDDKRAAQIVAREECTARKLFKLGWLLRTL